MKRLAWLLLCTVALCSCSGGTVQPIVIDLSHKTPTPTEAPPPTPTPAPPPAPAPEPPRVAAPPSPTPEPPKAAVAPTSVPAVEPSRSAPPPPPAVAMGRESKPEEAAEALLAAFNRHDLEGFLVLFAPDAVVYEFPGRALQNGIAQIRAHAAREFAEAPAARGTLVRRIVQGDFVIEQEDLAGLKTGGISSVTHILEVRAGRIQRMWLLR